MEKIGILTFQWADNYGAVLQAYGLQTYLQQLDENIEIINFTPVELCKSYRLFSNPFTITKKYGLVRGIKSFAGNILLFPKRYLTKKKFNSFRTKHLHLGPKIFPKRQVVSLNDRYKSIIVGSDQVWNPEFTKIEPIYLLQNGYHGLKFAYAASIAIQLSKEQSIEINKVISSFNKVSIREESTIRHLNNSNITNAIDPVFLLDKELWSKICINHPSDSEYIFVYDLIFNKEILEAANYYSKLLNLPIISYSNNKSYLYKKKRKNMGPVDFIQHIKDASLVITSSFHGMAFSIIFRKEFYVIKHPTRGSRMQDLLDIFNLSDRIIINNNFTNTRINYDDIDSVIEQEVFKSKVFIKEIIFKHHEN